ncbi:hypothetical protein BU17DRAFT_46113, partial [Hysterangium stoloniferum]
LRLLNQPEIFLPLKKLEKCCKCGSKESLKMCSRCAECGYCSKECQMEDWKEHKDICTDILSRKTDRMIFRTFIPFWACIADTIRLRAPGFHPAIRHTIINAPNPGVPAKTLPDRLRV